MKENLCWISDFPLRGSSFGSVTLELTKRLEEFKIYILSLGYSGIPITPYSDLNILPLSDSNQLSHYLRHLKPQRTVAFHSLYFLEKLTRVNMKPLSREVVAYIPVEGENIPQNLVDLLSQYGEIIVPSKHSQRILRKEGVTSKVVYHGVDTTLLTPPKERTTREFRWGYLGMNDIRKQIPRIIQAFSLLDKKERGSLVIAAPNRGHYNLPLLAQKMDVSPIWVEKKFLGLPLSQTNILDFYQTLDCYVNCATEAFGLPNLEATACGVPTIALGHGASPEVLGPSALYVGVKDFLDTNIGQVGLADREDLHRKMRTILEVPQERKRLIRNGERRVKLFTWERAVEDLRDILN